MLQFIIMIIFLKMIRALTENQVFLVINKKKHLILVRTKCLKFRGTTLIVDWSSTTWRFNAANGIPYFIFISETQLTGYLQSCYIKFFHQLNFSLKCKKTFTPPGHGCSTIIYMLVFYNNKQLYSIVDQEITINSVKFLFQW